MTWIPEAWNKDCAELEDEKEQKLIPEFSEVSFYVYHCVEKFKNFRGQSVRIWALQLICETETLKNMVFHDVYKDGLVWNELDSNNKPWVQNKFLNLCSAVSLRRSGSLEKPNPLWFTDPDCFNGKRGRAKIGFDEYNGEVRNVINWFNTPTLQQFEKNEEINQRIFTPIEPIDETKYV